MLTLAPNEIGDSIAGLSGSLAFIWIIVTVILQSRELRAQREELELARAEYARMADAQAKQATIMQDQAEIFRDERISRDEARSIAELDQRILRVSDLMSREATSKGRARRNPIPNISAELTIALFQKQGDAPVEHWIKSQSDAPRRYLDRLETHQREGTLERPPSNGEIVIDILEEVSNILALFARLPESARLRIRNLELERFAKGLQDLRESRVWGK